MGIDFPGPISDSLKAFRFGASLSRTSFPQGAQGNGIRLA